MTRQQEISVLRVEHLFARSERNASPPDRRRHDQPPAIDSSRSRYAPQAPWRTLLVRNLLRTGSGNLPASPSLLLVHVIVEALTEFLAARVEFPHVVSGCVHVLLHIEPQLSDEVVVVVEGAVVGVVLSVLEDKQFAMGGIVVVLGGGGAGFACCAF